MIVRSSSRVEWREGAEVHPDLEEVQVGRGCGNRGAAWWWRCRVRAMLPMMKNVLNTLLNTCVMSTVEAVAATCSPVVACKADECAAIAVAGAPQQWRSRRRRRRVEPVSLAASVADWTAHEARRAVALPESAPG